MIILLNLLYIKYKVKDYKKTEKVKQYHTMNLVSVIMPVYNTEESYLKKSIESVLRQTYQNFELIIIDDGSCDEVAKLCDLYAKYDDRIIVIHKNNEGVSCARNYALSIAQGEYYAFLDSDDTWSRGYLDEMLAAMTENKLDLVMCNYFTISEDDGLLKVPKMNNGLIQLSREEAILKLLYMQYPSDASAIFATIYKSSVTKTIRFNSAIALAEDVIYKFECMKVCNKIAFLNKCMMSYRIRLTGTMKSCFKKKYLNTLDVVEQLICSTPEFKEALIYRLTRICFVLLFMKGVTEKQRYLIKSVLYKYRRFVIKDKNCDIKMLVAVLLNYIGII